MVKTRRSNGENGEVDDGNYTVNDVGSVSDEKASNWSQRELRSSQYKVTRKIQRWPTKYSRRRRSIKMPRIVFPESDTEPEKYSRRSRQVRVFFADDNASSSRIRRSRGPRKNYVEDSEDKPIQENVRRSCRKRKLLHHSFNESWITNELKVKGYPDLYGFPGSSSSDEFTSGDEGRRDRGKKVEITSEHVPTNTDEDTQLSRQRRTSARFTTKKNATETDSDEENNQTVIEKKPLPPESSKGEEKMETEPDPAQEIKTEQEEKVHEEKGESNQRPIRSLRTTRTRNKGRAKKDDSQQETASESSSTESGSELTLSRQPRRSKRTRKPKPAFVQIAQGQTRGRAQSPSSSSSSSTSSDTEEDLNVSMKNKTKGRQKTKANEDKKADRALRDIQPIEVDGSVRFSSVGGLEEHIKCLREMVLFPLMYPSLFQKFNTRPAKGVLFHGPPGTGKTLLARALANECSLVGGRKVAFFMRKGADCLKKWVGESERHLKLLFQQANKMKPSIIFFDEIDALAPVRSVRQEQVHTSVVGTLLAEMDGLCDRGEVIIIGATNRLDAVDPALRRAGRFDRELHFPPPHAAARRDILNIYTKDWRPRLPDSVLEHVAELTAGYGGSDLKALCSEAVLKALRRVYPQVYESEHALLIDAKNVEVSECDLLAGMGALVSAGARSAPPAARRLPARLPPLLQPQLRAAAAAAAMCARNSSDALSPSVLLICGECSDSILAPAVLWQMEGVCVRELSVCALHAAHTFTVEQALISLFSECRRADSGCVLFVRDVVAVWSALGPAGGMLFKQLWRARAAGERTLLLATATAPQHLPLELQDMFPMYKDCIYQIREPHVAEVIAFLKPLLADAMLPPPPVENAEPPPPLPRAPPPPPPRESEEEISRRKRKEDYKLRELRIFLRDICRKLASNRRFYKFTKPVDLEEVTDYLDIIKMPMDLETMMTKVDMHKYNCAKEFLDDIDLICANALEYNPDRTSSDKQIRHEACSLRDHAHALIDVEMDSDFELECQEIAKKRREEGDMADNDLPDFIYTASNLRVDSSVTDGKNMRTPQNGDKSESQSVKRKRRRMNAWSKGLVVKRQKTSQKTYKDPSMAITDEESKENKPITSTPLPNGDASSSSGSDDDAPLRRPQDDSDAIFNITAQSTVNNHVLESPTKSTEKPTKTSPKKRNSGHEATSGEADKVLINKTELENVVYKNAKALRLIGLEALIDLYSQLSQTINSYADKYDRMKLPQELNTIVYRYLQVTRK
ncbi:ATPase family AAA domain-containing protein 2-like isoform X2 [Amyelois transitella]|uniref:ATPase family AAA domain-containing protein 2-like isoform X2 n=1 Tax=Amyelois transitella TaxID=680683 RepID=UPI00298F643C|nr:ATPase family AAA domain-containing protein 2-like isoform X2 [Amyelois transitella]